MKLTAMVLVVGALFWVPAGAQREVRFDPSRVYPYTEQGRVELREALEALRAEPEVTDIDLLLASLQNHQRVYGIGSLTGDILLTLFLYFQQFGVPVENLPEELVLFSVRTFIETPRYQKVGREVLAQGTPPRVIVSPKIGLSDTGQDTLRQMLPPGTEIVREEGDVGLFFDERGLRNILIIRPLYQFRDYYEMYVVIDNGHQAGMHGLFELNDEGPLLVSYY